MLCCAASFGWEFCVIKSGEYNIFMPGVQAKVELGDSVLRKMSV